MHIDFYFLNLKALDKDILAIKDLALNISSLFRTKLVQNDNFFKCEYKKTVYFGYFKRYIDFKITK